MSHNYENFVNVGDFENYDEIDIEIISKIKLIMKKIKMKLILK